MSELHYHDPSDDYNWILDIIPGVANSINEDLHRDDDGGKNESVVLVLSHILTYFVI